MRVKFIPLFLLLTLAALIGCTSSDDGNLAGPVSVEIEDADSPNDYDVERGTENYDESDDDGNEDSDDEWSGDDGDVDYEGESDVETDEVDFN